MQEGYKKNVEVLEGKVNTLEMGKEHDAAALVHLKTALEQRSTELDISQKELKEWKDMAEMYGLLIEA